MHPVLAFVLGAAFLALILVLTGTIHPG